METMHSLFNQLHIHKSNADLVQYNRSLYLSKKISDCKLCAFFEWLRLTVGRIKSIPTGGKYFKIFCYNGNKIIQKIRKRKAMIFTSLNQFHQKSPLVYSVLRKFISRKAIRQKSWTNISLAHTVLMDSTLSIRKIIYFLKLKEFSAKMKTGWKHRQKGTYLSCSSFPLVIRGHDLLQLHPMAIARVGFVGQVVDFLHPVATI